MNLTSVIIHVTDLEPSIQFYENVLGMKVMKRFPAGPNQEIAYMEGDGANVELIAHKDLDSLSHDSHLALGVQVDSLEEAMEKMQKAGVPIESGPFEPNPTIRFFFIQDPNGVTIEILQRQ